MLAFDLLSSAAEQIFGPAAAGTLKGIDGPTKGSYRDAAPAHKQHGKYGLQRQYSAASMPKAQQFALGAEATPGTWQTSLTADRLQSLAGFVESPLLERQCLLAVARGTRDDDLEQFRRAFADMDEDGDGVISLRDMQMSLARLQSWSSEKIDVERLFRAADLDGNGTVDFSEFSAACLHTSLAPLDSWLAEQAFHSLDVDGDGLLHRQDLVATFQEVPAGLPHHRKFAIGEWNKHVLQGVRRDLSMSGEFGARATRDGRVVASPHLQRPTPRRQTAPAAPLPTGGMPRVPPPPRKGAKTAAPQGLPVNLAEVLLGGCHLRCDDGDIVLPKDGDFDIVIDGLLPQQHDYVAHKGGNYAAVPEAEAASGAAAFRQLSEAFQNELDQKALYGNLPRVPPAGLMAGGRSSPTYQPRY
eukprot:TRINITY_DN35144_c0_g1_i1.p1 TRINITY_DN35144_c0_g1~~TRINITY_DN35144_c0_g1_i1.p1  ORF type:complete len:414 (+),score=106.99 TRINITY_DN35144_c0_g1_i1:124-1365(+)